MNVTQIKHSLKKAGKSVGERQVFRLLKKINILPVGARQRPQIYPADSADRILNHLGLGQGTQATLSEMVGLKPFPDRKTKLVTRSQLHTVKPKAKGTK